jgi:hypothetical protein
VELGAATEIHQQTTTSGSNGEFMFAALGSERYRFATRPVSTWF